MRPQKQIDVFGTLTTPSHSSQSPDAMKIKSQVVFYKKSPSAKQKRVSFSIVRREVDKDTGCVSQKKHEEPAVTALNRQLAEMALSFAEVAAHVDDIVRTLNESERKKREGIWIANSENQKLIEQYWDQRYYGSKIRRPETARYRLQWAIGMVGQTSIIAPKKEIQKIVDQRCAGNPSQQRRLVAALNAMRIWFGLKKPDMINREPKPQSSFKYHTKEQFERALSFVESSNRVSAKTYKALFHILFSSGARTGEAFAFKAHMRNQEKLKIHTQIDRYAKEVPTKNSKRHTTILFEEAIPDFDYWLSAADKKFIVRGSIVRVWKRACMKAFPDHPELWITVHDLRHSYAVRMLTVHRQRIEVIAKLLGDTATVCEEYYLGFEQSDELLDNVLKDIRETK